MHSTSPSCMKNVQGTLKGQEESREQQDGWRKLREEERIWKGLIEEQCGEEDY